MHLIIFFAVYSCTMISISAFNKPPVILVPGLSTSQMQGKVAPPPRFNFRHYCDYVQWIAAFFNPNTYFNIHLNPWLWVPYIDKCTMYLLQLVYNNETRKTTDWPEIQTKVVGFGDPYWIEWFDYDWTSSWIFPLMGVANSYFKTIAVALQSLGYKRNFSLRGAPYDFRKGPNESQEFFDMLKDLVEDTYRINGNIRVVFVTHSYGGTMTVLFLQAQTQEWKDKYVRAMISLGGVFGGSLEVIRQYTRGDWRASFPKYISGDISKLSRSFPSAAFLMPAKELWGNKVLVSRPHRNYSLCNLEELYDDLKDSDGWEMWKDQQFYVSMEPPGVEFHCVYSTIMMGTVEKLVYDEEYQFPDNPRLEYGAGDGTVNLRSLKKYCKKWKTQQDRAVHVKHFSNLNHLDLIFDQRTTDYLIQVLEGYSNEN